MSALLFFMFNITMGYLIGSICSAVIVSRIFDLPDPRSQGSNNPGATNVLRLSGKKYAAIVLVVDMLKGFLPVLIAKLLGAGPVILGFTCFAAVLGHMYPIFFRFHGGKGVATALGALLGFSFFLGVMAMVTWLVVARLFRYSSLASITALIFSPFYSLYVVGDPSAFLPLGFITIFVLYKHRDNVTRLFDGTESKISFGKKGVISEELEELSLPLEPIVEHKPKVKAQSTAKAKVTSKAKLTPKPKSKTKLKSSAKSKKVVKKDE
jgi:glycerol-3-phosphate acyltransferase PlsY